MSDGNDIYWDLYELNPDAVIYIEYEDAYVGYTSNAKGFWVAVYAVSYTHLTLPTTPYV